MTGERRTCVCCGCDWARCSCACCCGGRAVDEEEQMLELARDALAVMREYPRDSPAWTEAREAMSAALNRHAAIVSERLRARFAERARAHGLQPGLPG